MRRVWVVSALMATACAGGQTGEITELTAFREAIGAVSVDEASEAGLPASSQESSVSTAVVKTAS